MRVVRPMAIHSDQMIQIAGYGYVGSLFGSLWWYGTRKSSPARCVLALLIFLPAGLCFYAGLSMFAVGVGGPHHTPGAVSDPSGLVPIIAIGVCVVGVVIAFFGIRVLTKPLKKRRYDDKP